MKTAFHGLEEATITFETNAAAADCGKVCKASGDGGIAVCAAGDEFFGVIGAVHGGAAGVQMRGYAELPYSGNTAPTVGWCGLVADGNGGVKPGEGHEFLVISVDTAGKTVGLFL